MSSASRGHKLFLQLGLQTVLGTPVAATGVRMELIDWTNDPQQGSAEDPSLIDNILSPREIFQFGRYYAGTVSFRLGYLGLLKWWQAITGTGSSPATPAVSVADSDGQKTFTYKQGFALPLYTAEVLEGGYDGTTTVAQFVDVAIENLRISGEAVQTGDAGVFRGQAQLIARTRNIGITPAALSLVSDPETAVFKHLGTLVDGLGDAGSDFECKQFQLEISNPIDKERFAMGSVSLRDIQRGGRQSIDWTMMLAWLKNTQVAALEAWTDTAPHALWTGEVLVGAAGHRSLDITSPKTKVVSVSRPIDRFGTLYQTVKYKAKYDASTSTGITITAKNESATIAAG